MKKTLWKLLPLLLFIAVLLFSGLTAYRVTYDFLDSDAASELVLGHLLAEQNVIATPDWLYSSEIRLFGSNLVYLPLFKLFTDWHTVRFLSIMLFMLLMAGSYFYLSRRMKISLNAYFLSASLMLLPLNIVYGRIVLYHDYYVPCIVYGFVIAGLFLSVREHRGQRRVLQALRVTALLLLSFISCLNGFRQFPAAMLPLFLAALAVALREHRGAPDTLASAAGQSLRQLVLAGAVLAAGFAGLYVNSHILSQVFSFRNLTDSVVSLPTADNLRNLLAGYLSLFGFQEGRTIFSAEGLLALGGVFAAAVLCVAGVQDLIPRKKPVNSAASFIGTLYPVAMLSMTLVFLLLSGFENYPQYYLPVFAWLFPYLGFWMDQNPLSFKTVTARQVLVVLACLCLAANGAFYNLYFLSPDGKQVDYDINIPYDTAPSLEAVSEFLVENECEVGYASFWLCNVMAEITGGQVSMICIEYDYSNPGNIYYYDYLTYRQTRELDFVEGKSVFFLVANVELNQFNQSPIADYAVLIYEDTSVRVYAFDLDTEVWEYLLSQAEAVHQTSVLEQLKPEALLP